MQKLHALSTDTREVKVIFQLIDAVNNLTGRLSNVFTSAPAVFTVGTTAGAPTNGASTWTISTINVIGKNPVFLLDGVVQNNGVDYTFDNSTGIFTLASGTFATSQVWTVLY